MKRNFTLSISGLLVVALLLMPLQGALGAMPVAVTSPMLEMLDTHAEHNMAEPSHMDCQHCDHDLQVLNHGSHSCHDENGNCLFMGHCMFGVVSFGSLSNSDFSPPFYLRYSAELHTIDLPSEIEPPRA